MVEEATETPNPDEVPAEGQPKPALKSKKKFLIIVIIIVLLLIVGGIGAYFFFFKHKKESKEAASTATEHTETEQKKEVKAEEVFLDLNEFIVNLDSEGKQPSFLKMEVTLQLPNQEVVKKIQAKMPLIQDTFQTYLREIKADDLEGSAGIYRLREELLLRINKVMFPEQITDILFKEFLVQ
ncbi:MAG: flagellar basal body-associated FliL family protein [Alphaproteobacteria bacterium]